MITPLTSHNYVVRKKKRERIINEADLKINFNANGCEGNSEPVERLVTFYN